MKKEYIIPIAIILVIIVIILTSTVTDFQAGTIKVGDAEFTLPSNYAEGTPNKMNDTTIDNGNNKIYLSTCDSKVKSAEVDPYMNNLEKRNLTGKLSTLKVNDTTIYKVDIPSRSTTHYWFELGGKGYTVYVWEKVDNLDNIVKDLVGSAVVSK